MRLGALIAAAWLLMAGCAQAQMMGVAGNGLNATVAYTGMGDLHSWTSWGGLRAYSAAAAAALANAITVRRTSDNTTQNVAVLSSGALNVANANTFAGTDATASCTIATTTMTCTGASSTPHVNSTVSGAGISQPCYLTAVGTFTGGAGTATVSNPHSTASAPCGTVGSPITATFQYGLFLSVIFDQTGNGNNWIQTTNGFQPQFFPTCENGLPCWFNNGGSESMNTPSLSGTQPNITFYTVFERVGNFSSFTTILGAGTTIRLAYSNTANTVGMYAGSFPTETANDNTLNYGAGVFNGASSIFRINGSNFTVNPGAGGFSAVVIEAGNDGGGGGNTTTLFTEVGYDAAQLNTTQLAADQANVHAYWCASVGSC